MAIRNIQDGGRRHLEFVRIENSAIRSAVPENPTLEQNMKWIGSPVAFHPTYGHSRMLGAYGTPVLEGKERSYGVSDGTIRKSDGGFL